MVVDRPQSLGQRSVFLAHGSLHSLFEYCLDMAAEFPPEQVIEKEKNPKNERHRFLNSLCLEATSLLPYPIGHTDQPGTVWEGTP